jgi:membrane protease YdiL (CAAX protease family)
VKLAELHPRAFFLETWQQMDREAAEERAAREAAGLGYDWRPIIALLASAVLLTLMEYIGNRHWLDEWITRDQPLQWARDWRRSPHHERLSWAWWAGWRVLGYFLLPMILVRLYGERVRDQGLSTKGLREHLWLYVLCYLVVAVCVLFVSRSPEFVNYYPFYKGANKSWADFLGWELMYAAQFFALEFFFRGWWLKACKAQMGSHAIFVMTVPYVMIHFGKPMLETFGACIAGVVLGTLAMKTRSIWSGFFVHVGVAISMDLAAMMKTIGLPTTFWPPGG